jgi:hypothetical protein
MEAITIAIKYKPPTAAPRRRCGVILADDPGNLGCNFW